MLDKLPPQVLEHIAFYASTTHFLGPPSSLPSLLLCNHAIYDALNVETNPHLYARIYLFKFDSSAAIRRLKRKSAFVPGAADDLTATTYAHDLRRRFHILRHIKARWGTRQEDPNEHSSEEPSNTYSILWLAYLMLLENDGKNLVQLTRYARMERWLNDYWFGYNSWKGFSSYLEDERWPKETLESTLAMWVLWLLLDPPKWIEDSELEKMLQLTLKTFALSAHKYPLCRPEWQLFYPPEGTPSRTASVIPNEDPLDAVEASQQTTDLPRPTRFPFASSHPFPPIPHISKSSAMSRTDSLFAQTSSTTPSSSGSIHLLPAPIAVPATLIHSAIIEHRVARYSVLDYVRLRLRSLDEDALSSGAIRFSDHLPDIGNTSVTLANRPVDSDTIYTPILDRPIRPRSPSDPDKWVKERDIPKPPFSEDYRDQEKDDLPQIAWSKSSDAATKPEFAPSIKWDYEWRRMLSLASIYFSDTVGKDTSSGFPNNPGLTVKPGSVEGIWEGTFGYAEFTSYTALLSGAPPKTAAFSIEANHRQTWKLREYHLLSPTQPPTCSSAEGSSSSDSPSAPDPGHLNPTIPAAGNPLLGYLPPGAVVLERSGSDGEMVLEVQEPMQQTEPRRGVVVGGESRGGVASSRVLSEPIVYHRWNGVEIRAQSSDIGKGKGKAEEEEDNEPVGKWEAEEIYAERVRDIIVIGEGHSAWGQFQLLGRVRPCDGLINVYKTYNDGIRGNWLYRGYLIGTGEEGNIVGRWRDTLSPIDVHGYEGRYTLTRRKNHDGI